MRKKIRKSAPKTAEPEYNLPMEKKKHHIQTRAAHAGMTKEDGTNPPAVLPITQTSLFRLGTSDDADAIFTGARPGYMYSRFGNPTVDALAAAVADLERGKDALINGSGNAATIAAITMSLRGKDDLVIAPNDAYGGTLEALKILRETYNVRTQLIDLRKTREWNAAISLATVVFIESPTNPRLRLIDIADTVAHAKRSDTRVIVDNTVATPYNQQPLGLGADLVVHSLSKFLNGHSDMVGGAIVSRTGFTAAQRSIHKNLGGTMSAFDAWLLLRGLRTFPLRMEQHNRNGQRIAEWLAEHPAVSKVHYPGLPDHPQHDICLKQMRAAGAVLSFELKEGEAAARKFIDRLQLLVHGVSLGGLESLATRPAATSHRGMSAAMRKAAGVTDSLIRLSVGVEAAEDIIADLDQAMQP